MEAVGGQEGRCHLILGKDSGKTQISNNGGLIHKISFSEAIMRLGGKVDLVKMDCEGCEWEIFRDKDAWKNVNCLTMEYHLWLSKEKPSIEDLKQILLNLGFKRIKIRPSSRHLGTLLAIKN